MSSMLLFLLLLGTAALSQAQTEPRHGPSAQQRFIVALEPARPRGGRAGIKADVKAMLEQQGGRVALESLDEANPFIVFEGNSAEHAVTIAQTASRMRGVKYVEKDVVRHTMARPHKAKEVLTAAAGAASNELQGTPIQPYGLKSVQADQFTTKQRSTTSSVDPTKTFPICIIDSGIDASHPALQGVRLLNGDPAGFNTDTCGHGTHVAGTISARNSIDGVLNGYVELNIVKVFDTSSCGWAYASTLIVAMQKCQFFKAKVVSMSLGGGESTKTEEQQINNMYSGGMLVFAAAGNGGSSDTSYPAGYANAISIAAVGSTNDKAGFSQYNADVELAAPGVAVLSTIPSSTGAPTVAISLGGAEVVSSSALSGGKLAVLQGAPVKAFGGAAVNCATKSCPAGTAGKVCIIPRGEINFCEKATMCAAAGGVAAVIYNNAPGMFTGTLGSCPAGSSIPAFSMAQELAPRFADGGNVTAKVGSADIFGFKDGTSMATPHASAVAALVWSQRPACSNAVIRCALRASALDLGSHGLDTFFGYGLIQAKAAVDLLAGGCNCPQ